MVETNKGLFARSDLHLPVSSAMYSALLSPLPPPPHFSGGLQSPVFKNSNRKPVTRRYTARHPERNGRQAEHSGKRTDACSDEIESGGKDATMQCVLLALFASSTCGTTFAATCRA